MTLASNAGGGRVRIYYEGDTSDFQRANSQVQSQLRRLGLVQDQVSTKGQLFNQVQSQQRRNLSALATGAKYAAGGLGILAGVGFAKVVSSGIQFNATMESNELALKNLLGGAKEAREYLDRLYDLAKETPFEFTDLTSASRRLISFGLDADKTYKVLSATGDAVAAMGGDAENIDRVTLALGQMQAKGKVSAEELLQLTEAGIPAYKILKDELGLTGDQVANIGNEGIKADKAIDALTRGMEERFGGAAAKQAKTWDGLVSTTQDTWAQMTGAMTDDLFDELKRWEPEVIDTMNGITRVFDRKDLDLGQKIERSLQIGEHNFRPLWDELQAGLEDAEIGNKLIDAVEWAIPRLAERSGRLGVEIAEGTVKGFIHADALGKLFIAGTFIRYLGGWGAFATIGKAMGARIGTSLGMQLPSTVATKGGAAWGSAGTAASRLMGPALVAGIVFEIGRHRDDFADAFNDVLPHSGDWLKFDPLADLNPLNLFHGDDAERQTQRELIQLGALDNTRKMLHEKLALYQASGRKLNEEVIWQWAEQRKISAAGAVRLIDIYGDVRKRGRRALSDLGDRLVKTGRNFVVDFTDPASDALKDLAGNTNRRTGEIRGDVDQLISKFDRAGDAVVDFTDLGGDQLKRFAGDSDRQTGKVEDDFVDLRKALDRTGDKVVKFTDSAGDAAEKLADRGDRSADKLDRSFERMARRASRNVMDFADAVGDAYRNIEKNTNSAASALSVKKVAFGITGVGGAAAGAARNQTGGSIMRVPGTGSGDQFPMPLPSGSFVLNREASRAFFPGMQSGGTVNTLLEPGELAFDPSAAAMFGSLLPWMNSEVRRFAGGGLVTGDTDYVPALGRALEAMAAATHKSIYVNSGRRTLAEQTALYNAYLAGTGNLAAKPSPNAPHVLGIAADINPGRETFGGVSGRYGLGFTVPSESWHIQLLDGSAAKGVSIGNVPRIKRPILTGPDGPWKNIGQAGIDRTVQAARAWVADHIPTGGGLSGRPGKPIKSLPPALQKYNRVFPEAPAPSHLSAYHMPFNAVAALAEWAGMPGVSMARTAIGESALAPGASGIDPGGTKGLGIWMVTTGFNDALIAKFGGQRQMFNPVLNAQAASQIFHSQGYGAWYSKTKDTSNTHYDGPLLRRGRGGFVGPQRLARGGRPHPPGYNPPPLVSSPPRPMSDAARLTKLEIKLSNAQQTASTVDDQEILERIGKIYARQLRQAQEELDNLQLSKGDLRRARSAADADIRDLEKKLEKGGMTPAEYRRLDAARRRAFVREQKDILAGKESKALDKISELTDSLNSNTDQIKGLAEEAQADLVSAMTDLKDSIDEMNRISSSEQSIQNTELVRAIADLISGEIGGRTSLAGMNAGNGSVITA